MKILLVEDNLLNQKIVIYNLKKYDCEIVTVENGRDAFESFKDNKFDLVFMDIMLPDINGFEVTALIREYEQKNNTEKQVPIIALTAFAMNDERNECLDAGMNDYLSKPFTGAQLINKIEEWK